MRLIGRACRFGNEVGSRQDLPLMHNRNDSIPVIIKNARLALTLLYKRSLCDRYRGRSKTKQER
jgi:hypothetical protein